MYPCNVGTILATDSRNIAMRNCQANNDTVADANGVRIETDKQPPHLSALVAGRGWGYKNDIEDAA